MYRFYFIKEEILYTNTLLTILRQICALKSSTRPPYPPLPDSSEILCTVSGQSHSSPLQGSSEPQAPLICVTDLAEAFNLLP